MQRRLLSGRAIGMIAARVVVASDETVLATLRKSKIYNASTENDGTLLLNF